MLWSEGSHIGSKDEDTAGVRIDSRVQALWTRAAISTNQADPFCCSPGWQLSFHDSFSPDRRLLIRESSGSLLVFAEKVFAQDDVVLSPMEAHWFFGCPVLGRHGVDLLVETLPAIARHYHPFFPRLVISGIRPGGVLARRLIRALYPYFEFYLHSAGMQCGASLAGGLDGYLSRRSANHRRKLKRQNRRAMAQGLRYERAAPATEKEADAVFERMLAVELTSWKGLEQCGMDQEPATSFYRFMLRRLSHAGQGRVIFARHGDRDIGYIFGGLAGKVYRGQQFSYDNEWRDFAIGNLLQVEQLGWLCEEGVKRYDMGPIVGPKMEYKRHWTEKTMRLETWMLVRG